MFTSTGFRSTLQKSLGFENSHEGFAEYSSVTFGFDFYAL